MEVNLQLIELKELKELKKLKESKEMKETSPAESLMSWLDVEDLSFAWKFVSLQQGVEKDKDKYEDGYQEKDKDKDIPHL